MITIFGLLLMIGDKDEVIQFGDKYIQIKKICTDHMAQLRKKRYVINNKLTKSNNHFRI